MSILDRALRMGEARQFKQYAKRVDRINAWEEELELLDDAELRSNADGLRERAATASRSRTCCPRPSRSCARWAAALSACATSTSR